MNGSTLDRLVEPVVRTFTPEVARALVRLRADRTRCGRATVAVLALNARDRVELGAELIADGVFPPVP